MKPKLLDVCIIILLIIFATFTGYLLGKQKVRREAFEHGYGNWQPDSNGMTEFVWRKPCQN